jgi:general secretion pathway protein F
VLRFHYKAATNRGEVVNGDLLDATREGVVHQLQTQGLTPIRVYEIEETGKKPGRRWFRKDRVTERQVADMTRELASLLEAGLPLDRSLAVLQSLAISPAHNKLMEEMRSRIKEGASLAEALEEQSGVFNRLYISLVRAGEAGGALDAVLKRLAEHLEQTQDTRSAIVSALFYPAVLVVVAIVSITILLGYVVPQFTQMFEDVGQALPLSTRFVIGTGEFVQAWGWTLPLAIAGAYWYMAKQLTDPVAERQWHGRLLKLPTVGHAVIRIEIGRFTRTLATLLRNGVSLLEALAIANATMGNRALAHNLDGVADGLREGRRLADTLGDVTDVPAFAVNLIRVGEESGQLPEMLERIALSYERETDVQLKRTVTLMEPVLILILGGIIAGVIISILLAIMSINDLVV